MIFGLIALAIVGLITVVLIKRGKNVQSQLEVVYEKKTVSQQALPEINDLQNLISLVRSSGLKDSLFDQWQMLHQLEDILKLIRDFLDKEPEQVFRQPFKEYYLKTTAQLLQTYQNLDRITKKSSEQIQNAEKSKAEIIEVLPSVIDYFSNYLNRLFESQYFDISSETEVIEAISKPQERIKP
ncbi:hypothetical protein Q5O14_12675 [Eubacteriaceae bacterium ES2]|nr:hypothetical protein Q5O14_12675 [Eubacteriaceae bacterium ES2]